MKVTNLTSQQRTAYQAQPLLKKIETAKKVISQALDRFGWQESAIAWTGGKDSTLLLWLVREVAREQNKELPICMFIDEGDVFPEIWEFVEQLKQEWQLDVSVSHNKDVSSQVEKLGDMVQVEDLNQRNQAELKRLGFTEQEFPYEPESYVGNHLMKTVATNQWLEEHGTAALIVGVRWDEQEARSTDDFVRELQQPDHARIEPLLAFSERDVWDAIHQHKIPYVKLYEQGFRSLGARVTTEKTTDIPAWDQDLDNTTERAGRRQDKEKIMSRLRDLGYM